MKTTHGPQVDALLLAVPEELVERVAALWRGLVHRGPEGSDDVSLKKLVRGVHVALGTVKREP